MNPWDPVYSVRDSSNLVYVIFEVSLLILERKGNGWWFSLRLMHLIT